MKALYVTSVDTFSGKTAVCLALGRRIQEGGHRVGYFKPVLAPPPEAGPGPVPDEDADFVRRTLGLGEPTADLAGLLLTRALRREFRRGTSSARDLISEIRAAYLRVAVDKDVVLLEGGATLWEGVSVGLDPATVSDSLDAPVLVVVRFQSGTRVGDDCVMAHLRLGDRLAGVLINAVPDEAQEYVSDVVRPSLEKRGVTVFGVLPLRKELQAIGVGELATVLGAEFLALPEKQDVLIEHLIVGAMSVAQALPRIRRVPGTKAVITGGDREDMQLVALETATSCLILTGHLRPAAEVLHRAEQCGVPVLLVRENTLETVGAINRVVGKTGLGQEAKLKRFEELLTWHCDFERLYRAAGLGR